MRSASRAPATRYQSSSRGADSDPVTTALEGICWARWKSLGSCSATWAAAAGLGGSGGGGGGAFLHAAQTARTASARRIYLRAALVFPDPRLAANSRKKPTMPLVSSSAESPSSAKSADSSQMPPQLSQVSQASGSGLWALSTASSATLSTGQSPASSSGLARPPIASSVGSPAWSRSRFKSATSSQRPPHCSQRKRSRSSPSVSSDISVLSRGQSIGFRAPVGGGRKESLAQRS